MEKEEDAFEGMKDMPKEELEKVKIIALAKSMEEVLESANISVAGVMAVLTALLETVSKNAIAIGVDYDQLHDTWLDAVEEIFDEEIFPHIDELREMGRKKESVKRILRPHENSEK